MIGTTFSQHYEAIRSRIRRLPRLLAAEVENLSYNDAARLIELFMEGIKQDQFRLKRLKPATVQWKTRRGYTNPETPLYGTNRKKNRFNNMMEIDREQTRWLVHPRKQDHWKAKIPLATLFQIHEYGATINGKTRNGKPTVIRIPPRPAFRYAYNKLLREKISLDQAEELRVKCVTYINTGKWRAAAIRKKREA